MKQFITIALLLLNILLIARLASAKTQVRGNVHSVSLWRGAHVVAASTDGWLCYDDGDRIACHRAIPRPTYKEIR